MGVQTNEWFRPKAPSGILERDLLVDVISPYFGKRPSKLFVVANEGSIELKDVHRFPTGFERALDGVSTELE
jgi:hypothetical protein